MSGREVTYEPYKAQRRPRPDLLSEQWPHLAPLAEAFGFHNVKVEGWEADDVIATLVRHAREAEIPVMVVSGDRDVYQVVGDGVRVMTTSRGVTETKVYDREGVIERYGVPPELVAGPDRAQGRHLRQHPRGPGDRRQDRRPAPAGVRLAGGGAGQRRQDLGREAQAEPDRARRRRPGLEAARDPGVRDRGADRRPQGGAGQARSQPPAGGGGGVRAAPGGPTPRRGVPGGRARPGRGGDPGRRGRGGDAGRSRRRTDLDRRRGRDLGGQRRRSRGHRRRPGPGPSWRRRFAAGR